MPSEPRNAPKVGDKLRSRDMRGGERVVRVIEREMDWMGKEVRRVRVENVKSWRRTFLRIPLLSEWEVLDAE
jgi:hypothetical protein